MGNVLKKCLKISIGIFGAAVLLGTVANQINGFAQWYTENIYACIVGIWGRVFGGLPFSIAELLIYILIVGLIICVIKVFRGKMKAETLFGGTIVLASVLFFLYVTNCGINYHRDSFSECVGMEISAYSVEDLTGVCLRLTEDVNQISTQVKRNEQGLMMLNNTAQKGAVEAMHALGKVYEVMNGYYPQPKRLTVPWILAVQQLSGIYSPFTIEANYNSGMVDYNIPFTMCHELSHLRGFMQEEEANFIAYLACMNSSDMEFQYSGSLLAWIYCTNVLYKVDRDAWSVIRGSLLKEVNIDLKANSEYWDQYEGTVSEIQEKVNDTYLKANGQEDGVKSYSRMVDLMVMYYNKK